LLADELVLIGTDNAARTPRGGHVYAFEQGTGRVRWKFPSEVGFPSDVVRLGPSVYVVDMTGALMALDLRTGTLRWKFAAGAGQPQLADAASAVVDGAQVFLPGRDHTVYALDANSGEVTWQRSLGGEITTAVVAWSGKLYVGTADRRFWCLDQRDGHVVAELELPDVPYRVPVVAGDTLLLFLRNRSLASLGPSLTGIRWNWQVDSRWGTSRPLVCGGVVVAGDCAGGVLAFSLEDGTPRWSQSFTGEEIRSIGGCEDRLYVGTLRGTLYAWVPDRQADAPGRDR
jgi:outer membrane protein assembly factor BamB